MSDDRRSSKASSVSPVRLVSVKKSSESRVFSGELKKAGGRQGDGRGKIGVTKCSGSDVT